MTPEETKGCFFYIQEEICAWKKKKKESYLQQQLQK